MKTYNEGRIYKIYDVEHPNFFYIGSTVNTISYRMSKHRVDFHIFPNRRLYSYIAKRSWDLMKIELIELINGPITRKQLRQKEGEYQRKMKPTLNVTVECRPIEDLIIFRKQSQRHYRQENIDKVRARHKLYRQKNHDKLKQHYLNNHDKELARSRQYYRNNIKLISDKYILKYQTNKKTCLICCRSYDKPHRNQHERSKRHIYCANVRKRYDDMMNMIKDIPLTL